MKKSRIGTWTAFAMVTMAALALTMLSRQPRKTEISNGPGPSQQIDNTQRDGAPGIEQATNSTANSKSATPSESETAIVDLPPNTRVLSRGTEANGNIKESFAKLESRLTPSELQLFYTDLLLKDWLPWRDSLTEGVGWSAVFLQIDDRERRLALFATVKRIGADPAASFATRLSIYLVEEI